MSEQRRLANRIRVNDEDDDDDVNESCARTPQQAHTEGIRR